MDAAHGRIAQMKGVTSSIPHVPQLLARAQASGSFGQQEDKQEDKQDLPSLPGASQAPAHRSGKPSPLNREQEDQVTIVVGQNGQPLHIGSW